MKIAHAQLHMYTNIMYKFQSSTCKTVGEKHQKTIVSTDRRTAGLTDRRTDSHGDSSIPPSTSLWGYKKCENASYQHFLLLLQCFQKTFFFRVNKTQDKGKGIGNP